MRHGGSAQHPIEKVVESAHPTDRAEPGARPPVWVRTEVPGGLRAPPYAVVLPSFLPLSSRQRDRLRIVDPIWRWRHAAGDTLP